MKFTTYTDKGGRKVNEDAIGYRQKNGIYCFVAADGFGMNADVASRIAVDEILDAFEENPSLEGMRKFIETAQKALLIKKSEAAEFGEMGTTVAVLMTDGKKAVWATVGDTRVYIYRRSRIVEVSEDHSIPFEKFSRGEIEFGEIRSDREANKLRKALGDRLAWEPDISSVFSISGSHSFLLCTDGFWRNIIEEEMEIASRLSISSKGWLNKMLKKIAPGISHGSDNLSAITIRMQYSDTY